MRKVILTAILATTLTQGVQLSLKNQNSMQKQDQESDKDFASFNSKFQRKHKNQSEYNKRKQIFTKNKSDIDNFNQKESKRKGFRRGLNQFSDMTEEEKKAYQGLDITLNMDQQQQQGNLAEVQEESDLERDRYRRRRRYDPQPQPEPTPEPAPAPEPTPTPDDNTSNNTDSNTNTDTNNNTDSNSNTDSNTNPYPAPDGVNFNWRDNWGLDGNVKNQKSCGSCWSFSAVSALESAYSKKNSLSIVPDFSEQQLVDCDPYDSGCNGGIMNNAYRYLASSSIMHEADYQYTGTRSTCHYDSSKTVQDLGLTGYQYITTTEAGYMEALKTSPVAIAMNADDLYQYSDGVIREGPTSNGLNHGVTLIGYGEKLNSDQVLDKYWIIKNSWGANWGESGYFRVLRSTDSNNPTGVCQIYEYAVIPKVA